MKKIFTLIFIIALMLNFLSSKAQTGSGWEWASSTGVADMGRGVSAITTDAAGNIYATGALIATLTLEGITITGAPGYYHAYIAKYNSTGSLLWLKTCTSAATVLQQSSTCIIVDADGNIFVGGGQSTTTTTNNIGNGYIDKYDNAGNFVWNKQLLLYQTVGLNIDADGNAIAMETLPGFFNVYKLDKLTGNILWTTQNSGSAIPVAHNKGTTNFLDSKGNIYYSLFGFQGAANGSETIGGQTFTNPNNTACMVSLTKDGNVRWIDSLRNYPSFPTGVNSFVGSNDKVYFILVNLSAQNPYIYGGISGTNQPLTAVASYYELDTLGKVTKSLFKPPISFGNGTYFKNGFFYCITAMPGSATTSYTQSFGDYTFQNPNVANKSLNVVAKYDPATYDVLWANTFETTGGANTFTGNAIAIDVTNTGKTVLAGYYGATATFGNIVKTAVLANTNPGIKDDLFISVFSGVNVAQPSVTTWTGAANNMNYTDPANWDNGVPNLNKSIFPSGVSNYPNNIPANAKMGKLIVNAGATITLPLLISAPSGITNNGIINVTEAGIFFSAFNSGQTLINGTGKIVLSNNATYLFPSALPMNNSLEINCTGILTSFGANINGSLFLNNGILSVVSGSVILTDPNAVITSAAHSYVNGTITRTVNTSGNYTFPVGSSNRYAPATLQLNNITGPQKITALFTNSITGTVPNAIVSGQPVTQLLNAGIWSITPDVALAGGSYAVTLQASGYTNNVANPGQYVVVKRPNSAGNWAFYGNAGSATQNAGTITATASNITGFSDFAIGIANNPIVLPLKLLSFTATLNNNEVVTTWLTTNEINTRNFIIERSINGIDFYKIGELPAYNNSGGHTYTYTDKNITNLNATTLFYRLKQIDNDSKFTYSEIKNVKIVQGNEVAVYPNPTINNIKIAAKRKIDLIQLYELNGKKIKEWPGTKTDLDVHTILSGVYILKIHFKSGEMVNKKIVKQ